MTAIGVVLVVLGLVGCKLTFDPYRREQSDWLAFSALVFLIGLLLTLVGIAAWLWMVMP